MYGPWSNLSAVLFALLLNAVYLKQAKTTHDFKSFLHFETLSAEYVKGCYVFNESLGLCFDIHPGHIFLANKRNGELLALFDDIGRKTFNLQILDLCFVGQNSSLRLVSGDARTSGQQHPDRTNSSSSSINTDSMESVKYLGEIAEKFHKTPESLLLEDLASALAENISSFQMLHSLYLMSIGLRHIPKQDPQQSYETQALLPKKAVLATKNCSERSGTCQDLRSDPYKNRCLGMCGPGCSCWKFICKDCCFHEGCRQHDICCRHQAISTFCLTPFVYGFTCNGFDGYPKCLR